MEQATGALTVIEAVSKLQSVNPEYFPGKLEHSSDPSSTAGLCNPTSAHPGRKAAPAPQGFAAPTVSRLL